MQRAGSFYSKPYEMSYFYLIDYEDSRKNFLARVQKGSQGEKSISGSQLRTQCGFGTINVLLLERMLLGFGQLQKALQANGALSQQNQ